MNQRVLGIESEIHSREGGSPDGTPLVSVVIPAYNAALYIPATLDSVLAQTFRQYEIIVVNDGSPDTPELQRVLRPYAASIRYIEQENGGPSSARNTAIRAARGKYLAFLDSDDIWLPTHLANQVAILQSDPAIGLVYANGVQIEDDRPTGVAFDRTPQSQPVNFDSLLRETSTVNTSSAVVSRKAVLEAGLFDEQFKRCEDFDLWLRLASAGVGITFTRQIQIGHRLANGLAASGELMKQALIAVYQKTLSTQPLTEKQIQFTQEKIAQIEMTIQFERAKQLLLEGKSGEALDCIERAKALHPPKKLRMFEIGIRYFPRLLRSAYRAHLRRVERRKRALRKRSLEIAGFAHQGIDRVAASGSVVSK